MRGVPRAACRAPASAPRSTAGSLRGAPGGWRTGGGPTAGEVEGRRAAGAAGRAGQSGQQGLRQRKSAVRGAGCGRRGDAEQRKPGAVAVAEADGQSQQPRSGQWERRPTGSRSAEAGRCAGRARRADGSGGVEEQTAAGAVGGSGRATVEVCARGPGAVAGETSSSGSPRRWRRPPAGVSGGGGGGLPRRPCRPPGRRRPRPRGCRPSPPCGPCGSRAAATPARARTCAAWCPG